tara:strand:- start:43 stop:432 length:390 start_codon:yes stop_codon:yes gene_type:complete
MGPVTLNITNNSGLSLLVINKKIGNIGGCANGELFTYNFDSSFTDNINSLRLYNPSTPDNYLSAASTQWLDRVSTFDMDPEIAPFTICASGDYNGVAFNATPDGWVERFEPGDLMANGGVVNITFEPCQ